MHSFSLSRENAAEILQKAGVDEKARGETLSPERLALLSDVLFDTLGESAFRGKNKSEISRGRWINPPFAVIGSLILINAVNT